MGEDAEASFVLRASHSHLFPGARLAGERGAGAPKAGAGLVIFDDDSTAEARLTALGEGAWRLTVAAYRTSAGTSIAERGWDLVAGEGEGALKVTRLA